MIQQIKVVSIQRMVIYDDKIDFSLDSISGNTLVVYTMESYNDVISSYIVNSVISRGMPKNKDTEKVFRREIKLRQREGV